MKQTDKTIRYLGIDWGERRIGLAVADSDGRVAVPYGVVSTLDKVLETIGKEEVDLAVLGRPVKLSGEQTGLTAEYEEFARRLEERAPCPVEYIDERLSSRAADNLPGPAKTKAPRDAVAAMIILQSYLDGQK